MPNKKLDDLTGINYNAPVIEVRHEDLERVPGFPDRPWRSKCPACEEGYLLVRRDDKTLEIIMDDYCILCGQHVHYLDNPFDKWFV